VTQDNAMDPDTDTDAPPIGRDRTIFNLQQRIRLLQSMLAMAHVIIQESPHSCIHKSALQEIEKVLNHE